MASVPKLPTDAPDIYDLADSGVSAAVEPGSQAPAGQATCPHCHQAMSVDSRFCPACRYDTQTGRVPQGAEISRRTARETAASEAKVAGNFALGIALSALGAVIGVAVWSGIALGIYRELGFIAWLLGGLAGAGMSLGCKRQSVRAGIAAASTGLVGVLAAKVIIFTFVVYPTLTGNSRDIGMQREYVSNHLADGLLDIYKGGSPTGQEPPAQFRDAAVAAARKKVDGMSDEAIRRRYRENWEYDRDERTRQARTWLAVHRYGLKTRRLGLAGNDPKEHEIMTAEDRRVKEMSPQELRTAIADLKKWQAGARWEDAVYVRDALIYQYADEAISKGLRGQELYELKRRMSKASWNRYYAAAAARVDAMSPEQRIARLKQLEPEERESMKQVWADLEKDLDAAVAEASRGPVKVFFIGMFGVLDIIFLLLALLTAYRVASGPIGANQVA